MKTEKIQMLLCGYGYWGKNLLRNMAYHKGIDTVGVVDPVAKSLESAKSVYPALSTFMNLSEALEKTRAQAVVIATPPDTHTVLALEALRAECHLLIEKPMAMSVEDCDKINALAEKKKKIVMVDHTFVYNPAVRKIAEFVHGGSAGDLLYFDSIRVNLGGFQKANVLWDLAPHDLSILDYLTRGWLPTAVSAVGVKHFSSQVESLCYVTFRYANNFVAHMHLNWAAPTKVRQIMLGGSEKMLIYDDNTPAEKIRIYDKGVDIKHFGDSDVRVHYRVGDMVAPAIPQTEALSVMFDDFVESIRGHKRPDVDGHFGRRVVMLLDAISQSLAQDGAPVRIDTCHMHRMAG